MYRSIRKARVAVLAACALAIGGLAVFIPTARAADISLVSESPPTEAFAEAQAQISQSITDAANVYGEDTFDFWQTEEHAVPVLNIRTTHEEVISFFSARAQELRLKLNVQKLAAAHPRGNLAVDSEAVKKLSEKVHAMGVSFDIADSKIVIDSSLSRAKFIGQNLETLSVAGFPIAINWSD